MTGQTGGEYGEANLSSLYLDENNPRLPEDVKGSDQSTLLKYITDQYIPLELARSIARHGYFRSEPLIIIPHDPDGFTVVEGNRRLVALRLLQDPTQAGEIDDLGEWEELASQTSVPDPIPVVTAVDRRSVAPIIGYRHISGIEPWDPFAKARFVAHFVDNEGLAFEEVANLVGESVGNVAASYRNQAIIAEAKGEFSLPVENAVEEFGVFTRAMNSPALRNYIGAAGPGEVTPRQKAIPQDKGEHVEELLSWLFGEGDQQAVIDDSRQITALGEVVASEIGLDVLRTTRDINQAHVAAGGLRERLLRRLNNAYTNLMAANEDIADHREDEQVRALVNECYDALRPLLEEIGAAP